MLQWVNRAALIAGALALSLCAQAETPNCAGTQYEMNLCASPSFQAEDAELNRRYSQIMQDAADDEARHLLPCGRETPHHAAIAIGGSGFCAAPQDVWLEYPDGDGLPMLVVDDGACDAFRFGLTEGAALSFRLMRD